MIWLEWHYSNPRETWWRHGRASLWNPCLGIVWHVVISAANESPMSKHWQRACPERCQRKVTPRTWTWSLAETVSVPNCTNGPLLPSWASVLNSDGNPSPQQFSLLCIQLQPVGGHPMCESCRWWYYLSVIFTLCTSCGAVYCNRSCLWVCLFVGLLPW